MPNYKVCPNGHHYQGDNCPFCPSQFVSVSDTHIMADKSLASKMMSIPICKHCGRPLRKGIPRPSNGIRVSSLNDIRDSIVPWNYQWNGKCENCGYDYNISMSSPTGSLSIDNHFKITTVKCDSYEVAHHITANLDEDMSYTGFAGVEIETRFGNGGYHSKVFLSINELKYLFDALQGSPIMEQFNYYSCDEGLVKYRT